MDVRFCVHSEHKAEKGLSEKCPCVDGSVLARTFFTFCSIGRCSHVFGL